MNGIPKARERELCKALDALVAWMNRKTNKALSDYELVERKVDRCSFRGDLVERITDALEKACICEEKKMQHVDASYMDTTLVTAKHLREVKTERYEAPIIEEAAPLFLR